MAIDYFMGRGEPSDVIFTSSVYPTIVHKRVIDIFLDNSFEGWGSYPVEVRGKAEEPYPDYLGLVFTGRCGPPDDSKSEKFMVQMPGGLVPQWRGLYFDLGRWDGSDLFMSSARVGFRFAVGDVVRALKKAKVKNLRFELLSEVIQDLRATVKNTAGLIAPSC